MTKMAWEWNWPHRSGSWKSVISIDMSFMEDDHSPGFYLSFAILGWCLLDFGYYNVYHAS